MCADRTIINPQYASSLNGLFEGSANLDISSVTTNEIKLNSLTNNTDYAINSYSNVISITAGSATTTPVLQLTNSEDTVQLSCPSTGVLEISNQLRIVEAGSTNYVNVNCTGLGEANVESLLIGTTAPDTNVLLQCTTSNELSVPSLTATGNALIANALTVGPNVVGGTNYSYIKSPVYTGGIQGFFSSVTQIIPANTPTAYPITINFSPYDGWDVNESVVIPIFTGTNSPIVPIDIQVQQNSGTSITLNMTIFSTTTQTLVGCRGLIYYQPNLFG